MIVEEYSGAIPAASVYFPPEDIDDLVDAIRDILSSGRLTLGRYTEKFEQEFATSHMRRYAVAVNSGTSALEVILRALRIRDADVVVPTNTFAATAFAVLHSGNRVVFADVNEDLFLDPADLERRITPQTRAVVAVHIGGRIVPALEEIAETCEERGLALIEDAAHAQGSKLRGRFAGSFGIAAAFSFYPTKVMTSGEGGMIVTDEERLARACRILRDQGKAGFTQNLHTEIGNNWRMSELHAVVGLSQLRRLREFIEERRRAVKVYDEGLEGLHGLRILHERAGMRSNYYKYVAVLPPGGPDRSLLRAKLKREYQVSLSGEVYETPLHRQPVFQDLQGGESFPVAEDLCQRHICLPTYATMRSEQARFVVESLRRAMTAEMLA